jgi:hypothetical protein
MVKHTGLGAPAMPPPMPAVSNSPSANNNSGLGDPIVSPGSAPASGKLGPAAVTASPRSLPALGMAEEGPGGTILEGAAAIVGICRSTNAGLCPGERIVLAAYAVQMAQRAAFLIAEAQQGGGLTSSTILGDDSSVPRMGTMTKTYTTSTNAGMEGGLRGSFGSHPAGAGGGGRAVSSSFALSAVSSVTIIKSRSKEIVKDAMEELKSPDSTTQPAQTLLVNYVRRALLCAARQEFMREPHCAYGPVLEVYARCDVLVALLLKDEAMAESRALTRLRDKLADRIIAAHSTCGPFANFSQGELYSSQQSAARLA